METVSLRTLYLVKSWAAGYVGPGPDRAKCIASTEKCYLDFCLSVCVSPCISNPLNAKLNPICKSQLAELFCGVFKFCACFSQNLTACTQIWHRTPFMIESVLRYCADNKKRGLSMLPNVGHQIVYVKTAGIIRSSPYSPR